MTRLDNATDHSGEAGMPSSSTPAGRTVNEPVPHVAKRAPVIAEWITCSVIAVVAVIVMVQMLGLGLGTLAQPEAGLWPMIIAAVILMAVPFAVLDKTISEPYRMASLGRPTLMAVALLAFLPLYPLLGFILATFLMMFVILRYVCQESVKASLIVGTATPVVAYLLFGVIFQVSINPFPVWLGV